MPGAVAGMPRRGRSADRTGRGRSCAAGRPAAVGGWRRGPRRWPRDRGRGRTAGRWPRADRRSWAAIRRGRDGSRAARPRGIASGGSTLLAISWWVSSYSETSTRSRAQLVERVGRARRARRPGSRAGRSSPGSSLSSGSASSCGPSAMKITTAVSASSTSWTDAERDQPRRQRAEPPRARPGPIAGRRRCSRHPSARRPASACSRRRGPS